MKTWLKVLIGIATTLFVLGFLYWKAVTEILKGFH